MSADMEKVKSAIEVMRDFARLVEKDLPIFEKKYEALQRGHVDVKDVERGKKILETIKCDIEQLDCHEILGQLLPQTRAMEKFSSAVDVQLDYLTKQTDELEKQLMLHGYTPLQTRAEVSSAEDKSISCISNLSEHVNSNYSAAEVNTKQAILQDITAKESNQCDDATKRKEVDIKSNELESPKLPSFMSKEVQLKVIKTPNSPTFETTRNIMTRATETTTTDMSMPQSKFFSKLESNSPAQENPTSSPLKNLKDTYNGRFFGRIMSLASPVTPELTFTKPIINKKDAYQNKKVNRIQLEEKCSLTPDSPEFVIRSVSLQDIGSSDNQEETEEPTVNLLSVSRKQKLLSPNSPQVDITNKIKSNVKNTIFQNSPQTPEICRKEFSVPQLDENEFYSLPPYLRNKINLDQFNEIVTKLYNQALKLENGINSTIPASLLREVIGNNFIETVYLLTDSKIIEKISSSNYKLCK